MTALTERPERRGALAVGGGLIVVGLLAFAMVYTDIDPSTWLGGSGWTLFILVPGAALLVAGLLSRGDAALGMTISGSIVITIGAMLLGMDQSGYWESWAYAWALIPGAAGVGLVLHGLRTGTQHKLDIGVRLILISAGLLVFGAWFFETVFQTGTVPFDLGEWWPLILIGLGVIVVGRAVLGRPSEHPDPSARP